MTFSNWSGAAVSCGGEEAHLCAAESDLISMGAISDQLRRVASAVSASTSKVYLRRGAAMSLNGHG